MVKYFLEEEETDLKGHKYFKKVSEHEDKEKVKKAKKKDTSACHTCYHDEKNPRPCKREVLD